MVKRNQGYLLVFVAVLIILSLAGCAGRRTSVTVATAPASSQELALPLDISGDLVPAQTVNISSKITGSVVSLGFNVGQTVKPGDVLIQLDSESIKGQILSAQASVDSATAAIKADQNLAAIDKVNLDAAQKDYDRTKQLFDAGAASQSELDSEQDQLNTATKKYANSSGPTLEQANATLKSDLANLHNLNIQLADTTISSPLDGVISTQSVNVGEVITANTTVITIVDNSTLKLRGTVAQEDLPLLSNGQTVDVTVDSYPNLKFSGTVATIGPVAVTTGEVFPVEIAIKNDGHLMAGLSAHASILAKVQGIIIPAAALLQDNGESYVFVIKDNVAAKRVVKTGLKNEQSIQILQGLNQGEQVATSNVRSLADQMPVQVQK